MALQIKRVLISDKVDPVCSQLLKENGIEVDSKPGRSVEDIKSDIKNYDAMIVRSATKVTAEIIEAADNLKLIGRAGTGVDNIDIPAATARGMLVMNTPAGNTLSAAEHTCAMIAAVTRHIGQGHASLSEGKWERSKFMGSELNGKTLAIIGLGRIGRDVAHRMQSYGMKTIGYDPLVSAEEAAGFGVEWMMPEQIWPIANFITVHVPLIPPTKGLVNKKVFDICQPDLRVINVARGGIIDENDLLEALNNGKCAGAALDVFVTEPPTGVSMELAKHPKVLATPHLGASTTEAQIRVAKEIAQNIVDAVEGKPMQGLVNAPALSQSSMPEYKDWFTLATQLGQLTAQCVKNGNCSLGKVSVISSGDNLKACSRLLSHGVTYGLLKAGNASVNVVNCIAKAKEGNIQVNCTHNGNASLSLSVEIDGSILVSGSVVGSSLVLTSFNGFQLHSPLSLQDCVLSHAGSVSSFFKAVGDANISSMSTGTKGDSLMVFASACGSVSPSNGVTVYNLVKSS